jgi:ABC-2 type transport system permease protein
VLTRLDPLSYGVDALRGVLIGSTHFGSLWTFLLSSSPATLLLMLGAFRFSKIEV